MARTNRLTLAQIEDALRDMAYNGGPFTYYGVLAKMNSQKRNQSSLTSVLQLKRRAPTSDSRRVFTPAYLARCPVLTEAPLPGRMGLPLLAASSIIRP